eukprot:scaffold34596_cov222-Amphora_coffeaeformis.AAC.9
MRPSAAEKSSTGFMNVPPPFLMQAFTECDDTNRPPSLNLLLRSLQQLTYGSSDVRGIFTDHARLGSVASVAHAIGRQTSVEAPPLTPLAAFCLGHGLGTLLVQQLGDSKEEITIVLGRDPRPHGTRLADSLARGALSVDSRIRVYYTGLATTPACASFAQSGLADAAVMVTASHLPEDRNGFKVFVGQETTTKQDMMRLGTYAMECATEWYTRGIIPPSSGSDAVHCTDWVDWMPKYKQRLVNAFGRLIRGRERQDGDDDSTLLEGLKLVLNPGHGSGGFFNDVLASLGADVSGSIHVEPDGTFPVGVPNPESNLEADTIKACEASGASLGIMLDTDSDRCGFVVPNAKGTYESLHRNKLIALLGVVFSRTDPGCAIVTDSVTSEGLAKFLEEDLGLQHVRYLKGYANVIGKAQALTAEGHVYAPLAIETSGHCAMAENGYLDDGTYTAVKCISLLATEQQNRDDIATTPSPLLDLISNLEEVEEIKELRMKTTDGSLDTMRQVFDILSLEVASVADGRGDWQVDIDNLEGLRIRTGDSQFFMLRKSLHDPIISLQIESRSAEHARIHVVQPLLQIMHEFPTIGEALDTSALDGYLK